eukprot:7031247-Pyramimonas_sp.AAC.1
MEQTNAPFEQCIAQIFQEKSEICGVLNFQDDFLFRAASPTIKTSKFKFRDDDKCFMAKTLKGRCLRDRVAIYGKQHAQMARGVKGIANAPDHSESISCANQLSSCPEEDAKPDGGSARQQPISAAPRSPEKVAGPGSGSGGASGKRPRVPARVQARVETFLAALRKRCRGAPRSFRSASGARPRARQESRPVCVCVLFALRVYLVELFGNDWAPAVNRQPSLPPGDS